MAALRVKRYESAPALIEAVRAKAKAELEQVAPVFPQLRHEIDEARERALAWREEMCALEKKAFAVRAELKCAIKAATEVIAEAQSTVAWSENGPMRTDGPIPAAVIWAAASSSQIAFFSQFTLSGRIDRTPTILGASIRSVYIGKAYAGRGTDRIVAFDAIVNGYMPSLKNFRNSTVNDVLKTATKAAKIEREKLSARLVKDLKTLVSDRYISEGWGLDELAELRCLDPEFDAVCTSIEEKESFRDRAIVNRRMALRGISLLLRDGSR